MMVKCATTVKQGGVLDHYDAELKKMRSSTEDTNADQLVAICAWLATDLADYPALESMQCQEVPTWQNAAEFPRPRLPLCSSPLTPTAMQANEPLACSPAFATSPNARVWLQWNSVESRSVV
jgi:hypothetical protein